jgi:hypothetical protein
LTEIIVIKLLFDAINFSLFISELLEQLLKFFIMALFVLVAQILECFHLVLTFPQLYLEILDSGLPLLFIFTHSSAFFDDCKLELNDSALFDCHQIV